MEHHQELQGGAGATNTNTNTKISSCYNNSSCSSSSSRQSSSRWSPTSEQIRILKELYYNNGVRSPTADQIQRISTKLRQYGKIEGKNVFYWFQNHKARERQKKRFTTTTTAAAAHHDMMMIRPPPLPLPQPPNYRYHHQPDHHIYYNKFTPAGGLLNYGYGSVDIGQQQQQQLHPPPPTTPHNFTWNGPYSYADQTLEMEMGEEEEGEEERETLPLFPIHGDTTIKQQTSDYGYNSTNYFSATSSRASLELSLSSSYGVSRFHTTFN